MTSKNCLYCYKPLDSPETDFHARCSRAFFGVPEAPELPYGIDQIYELANQVVRSSVSLTGVQAKLSLDLETYKQSRKASRFAIVGLWGRYVLKPPTEEYASLPENEDLTMHLAQIYNIRTVPHSLIRLKSGELAYITKRIDRLDGKKLAMEDMCQLTQRLTEDKYKGSMEQVGKLIRQFSDNPGFDIIEFFEIAVFSFLVGNADMHLKNFSLFRSEDDSLSLSPAYNLVATRILLPADIEEMALTLNGKKRNFRRSDFEAFAKTLGIGSKVLQNSFHKFTEGFSHAADFIRRSFLDESMQGCYVSLLQARAQRLGLGS